MTALVKPSELDEARYPIGRFQRIAGDARPETWERRDAMITLAELPEQLRNGVEGLDAQQLATCYRDGGWNVRQVVHHLADSHINAFVRVRCALTENWPEIKTYDEAAWARLPDSGAPVEWSLELVESLHARWVMMLQLLTEEQWLRGFVHPVLGKMTIEAATLQYAWHSRHHTAHITHLRVARGW